MRRVYKRHISKGAFSLLEMIIVVAIIVILASALSIGVAGLIRTAKNSDDAVASSSKALVAEINDSEGMLGKYNFDN